jgi:hypothetical protein
MGYLTSTTLDQLDRLEHQYSRKNNRPSKNLRNHIGDQEKVIFCYYEIREGIIAIYILTDTQLIFSSINPIVLNEIALDRVKSVTVNYAGWFGSGGIRVYFDARSDTMFYGIKNRNFLHRISGIILNAKANYDVRLRSPTITMNEPLMPNQSSIAEQLEKLSELHESGTLTDDEYERAKGRILSRDA